MGEGRGWHSSITNTPQNRVKRIKHLLVNTCWWLQEDVMGQNLLGDSVGGVDMVVSVDEVDWVSEEMLIPY